MTPLGKVLADERKTKVFHDGEYDILILKRSFGFRFAGLFDTRVAAAALGASNPGLASVLGEYFGIQVDKSMQRSNWSARPLSEQQVRYALTGAVDEWRYKVGVDGEPAAGVTLRIIDVASGDTLWTGAGGKSGWSREALSAVAQKLIRDLLSTGLASAR